MPSGWERGPAVGSDMAAVTLLSTRKPQIWWRKVTVQIQVQQTARSPALQKEKEDHLRLGSTGLLLWTICSDC